VGYETVSEVEVRSLDLMGIDVEESSSRVYPQGETACHIVGYTSKISSTQLETYQNQGYPNDAYIGSDGIERSLEDQLSPYIEYRQGIRTVEVDTRGKAVRELSYTAPTDGNSVVLTIDAGLQNVMRQALIDTIDSILIYGDSLR
jgi:penicillin-binding protein 2